VWLAGLIIAALGGYIAYRASTQRRTEGRRSMTGDEVVGYALLFTGVGLTFAALR
jgi:hypothetical protein